MKRGKRGLSEFELIIYIMLLALLGGLALWFFKDKIFGMLG